MKILLIDNNDSFTYNLMQILKDAGSNVSVVKEHDFRAEHASEADKIILSPGPGHVTEYPNMTKLISDFHETKPILGVCLGHQAIASFFGAKLENTPQVHHGERCKIKILNKKNILFRGLDEFIHVGRYHSWVVDRANFPDALDITAETPQGIIMAISHKTYNIQGVQFHPESIMTDFGIRIIVNWLNG